MWMSAVERARVYGIDISLLRSCLLRSPEERLRRACDNASSIAHLRSRSADYAGLLDRLLTSEARFILVGGMAAAAQGSAYIPNDLDVCYDTGPENLVRLASVLRPIHPRSRQSVDDGEFRIDVETLSGNPLLSLRTDAGDLDLLACIDGVGGYRDCLAVSEPIPWGSKHLRVLAIEGLIVAKENWMTSGETGPLMALVALLDLSRGGDERQIPTTQCL